MALSQVHKNVNQGAVDSAQEGYVATSAEDDDAPLASLIKPSNKTDTISKKRKFDFDENAPFLPQRIKFTEIDSSSSGSCSPSPPPRSRPKYRNWKLRAAGST